MKDAHKRFLYRVHDVHSCILSLSQRAGEIWKTQHYSHLSKKSFYVKPLYLPNSTRKKTSLNKLISAILKLSRRPWLTSLWKGSISTIATEVVFRSNTNERDKTIVQFLLVFFCKNQIFLCLSPFFWDSIYERISFWRDVRPGTQSTAPFGEMKPCKQALSIFMGVGD